MINNANILLFLILPTRMAMLNQRIEQTGIIYLKISTGLNVTDKIASNRIVPKNNVNPVRI